MKLGLIKVSAIAVAALLASGCATNRAHKGAVIDPQLASSIQPGVDNKASVQKLLGTPTLAGQFTPSDWYYVSRDTNQLAFRNPHVTRQTVMLVRFIPRGPQMFSAKNRSIGRPETSSTISPARVIP